jgi:hypothetical protein
MKNMTKLKLSFVSLAFAVPVALSGYGQNAPQSDTMTMTTNNEPQMNGTTANTVDSMTPSQMGHLGSNSMSMADSSMNDMTSNKMNMANPPHMGNMTSGSMTVSNQSQMNDMTTNSMHNMAAPQTGNMESH